jgi:hypothetical protein
MPTFNVKGRPATAHQFEMGKLIVTTTRGRGGDLESCAGAVATAIQESNLTNMAGGDRDSQGLYQQRPSMGWGSVAQIRTPSYAIGKFLDQFLAYRKQGLGWLQASHKTQRSAFASAPARWYSEGVAAAKLFMGAGGDAGSVTSTAGEGGTTETREMPYEFSRGSADKPENSWDCMGRLADEVKWRRFMAAGRFFFVSDDWLARQAPLYKISEATRGVIEMSFDFETRRESAQLNVKVQTGRYGFAPGDVVQVVDEGPADGNWLVANVRRSLFSKIAEVTLTRKQAKLPEPAPQRETVNVGTQAGVGGISLGDATTASGVGNGQAAAVYAAAQEATNRRWSYSQPRRNSNGPGEYADCSSGVTWVLKRAGVSVPAHTTNAPVSGSYVGWGRPGPGQRVTVWCNSGHIWMQFKGFPNWRFDTGGGSGGKLWPTPRSSGGFVARHADGL